MSKQYISVTSTLMNISAEMSQLNIWQQNRPSEQALSSLQPFCIDTLDFSQWLQFVFIERLHDMIAQQQPLPTQSNVSAMAEEYFKSQAVNSSQLLSLIKQVDQLLEC